MWCCDLAHDSTYLEQSEPHSPLTLLTQDTTALLPVKEPQRPRAKLPLVVLQICSCPLPFSPVNRSGCKDEEARRARERYTPGRTSRQALTGACERFGSNPEVAYRTGMGRPTGEAEHRQRGALAACRRE